MDLSRFITSTSTSKKTSKKTASSAKKAPQITITSPSHMPITTSPIQTDIAIQHLPLSPAIVKHIPFTYPYPSQLEALSSLYQIPIPQKWYENVHFPCRSDTPGMVTLASSPNLLITNRTSSGKTFIAVCFMDFCLQHAHDNAMAVYVVPLKALGSEKYREFTTTFDGLYRVAVIMGDDQRFSDAQHRVNILITTYEKYDQLMRTQSDEMLARMVCVVFDEMHMVGDARRGRAIEEAVARLQSDPMRKRLEAHHLLPIRIIGLSATISNAEEVAEWFKAKLIQSSFRPVHLKRAIRFNDTLVFVDDRGKVIREEPIETPFATIHDEDALMLARYIQGESTLYFRPMSRGNVESYAKKFAEIVHRKLSPHSTDLTLPEITCPLDRVLQECIYWGVGFHHAGLTATNREFIEQAFIRRAIRLLVASPTLAIGVNVPAKWVILDINVFRDGRAMLLPVREYHQMEGRAGRPQFDTEGIAIINGGDDKKKLNSLVQRYILDASEPIESSFTDYTDIMASVLGNIAGGFAKTTADALNILKHTLAYLQFDHIRHEAPNYVSRAIKYMTSTSPPFLLRNVDSTYQVTAFGEMVNRMYISPETAMQLSLFVKRSSDPSMPLHPVILTYFLFAVTGMDGLYERKSDAGLIETAITTYEDQIAIITHEPIDRGALKTATILVGYEITDLIWADETIDRTQFFTTYNLSQGDMDRVVGNIGTFDWMMTCFKQIAGYHKNTRLVSILENLHARLQYGVSERVVSLCSLVQVKRARAKALYEAGFQTIESIARAPLHALANVYVTDGRLGEELAKKIQDDALVNYPALKGGASYESP